MPAASDDESTVNAAADTGKLGGRARAEGDSVRARIDVEGEFVAGKTVLAAQRNVSRRGLFNHREAALRLATQ